MRYTIIVAALLGSAGHLPAHAQSMEGQVVAEQPVDDIIVTATKRKTNLQSTPLAISSLSGDTLADRQIDNLESLASAIPNVNFNRFLGQARVTIRGLGNDATNPTGEARVAFHIDGIYVSRNAVTMSALFDVERVEVVRGPQGTLYGRNATAGAINLITRKPGDTLDGYATLGVGNYGLVSGDLALGGPVSSTLSLRAAGTITRRGGFGENLQTGRDIDNVREGSGRVSARWRPDAGTDVILTADYHLERDRNYQQHYNGTATTAGTGQTTMARLYGGIAAADPRDINSDRDGRNYRRNYGASLHVSQDLSDHWSLQSLTGYRYSFYAWDTDMDGSQIALAPYGQAERSHQYSQELQLHYDSNRVNLVLGAFGFKENAYGRVYILLQSGVAPPSFLTQGYRLAGDLDTRAGALFGEGTIRLTDRLSAVLGARYSVEEKTISDNYQLRRDQPYLAPVNGPYRPGVPIVSNPGYPRHDKDNWNSFTPKAGLSWQATDDLFLFGNYSRGFKSGGFSPGILQPSFRPEIVDSFEIGERATLFDRALTLNLSAFHYNYTDMQVNKLAGTMIIVENASSAKIDGIELETIVRPGAGWQLDVAGSWLNTRFGDYVGLGGINNKGNRLPLTSTWQGLAGIQKRADLGGEAELLLRGELEFRSGIYFTEQNLARLYEPGRAKLNLFATFDLPGPGLKVAFFARNLTNKRVWANVRAASAIYGGPLVGVMEAPRTFGVNLTKNFQ